MAFAATLALSSPALAGWGEEWGTLVLGKASAVPTIGWLGLGVLALGLAASGAAVCSLLQPVLGASPAPRPLSGRMSSYRTQGKGSLNFLCSLRFDLG